MPLSDGAFEFLTWFSTVGSSSNLSASDSSDLSTLSDENSPKNSDTPKQRVPKNHDIMATYPNQTITKIPTRALSLSKMNCEVVENKNFQKKNKY